MNTIMDINKHNKASLRGFAMIKLARAVQARLSKESGEEDRELAHQASMVLETMHRPGMPVQPLEAATVVLAAEIERAIKRLAPCAARTRLLNKLSDK